MEIQAEEQKMEREAENDRHDRYHVGTNLMK